MVRIHKSQLASLRNSSVPSIHTAATNIIEQAVRESSIFDPEAADKIPRFDVDELLLGHVLGRGGFCAVRELTSIKICDNDDDKPKKSTLKKFFCFTDKNLDPAALLGDDSVYDNESVTSFADSDGMGVPREKLIGRLSRPRQKDACGCGRYVVKQINSEFQYTDKISYLKAIVDIELEARYMMSLRHPNIMRIRGLANVGPASGNSFLILDRLSITLAKKMADWMRRDRQCRGITGAVVGSKKKKEDLLVERLVAAHNIADAVDYLHGRGIIFRDLKPDNLGFDAHGTLKLFDFGLAREVREEERYKDTDLYRLTGFTGAIRYMAPEVGLRRCYNFKADVYSWSQLMWYILELEPPLGVYTPQMFQERVFKRGTRPAVMERWPEHMAALMKACWSANISERPTFQQIKEQLGVIMMPYNTKKLLPNRFNVEGVEPAVPGTTVAKQGEATASLSESSADRKSVV